MVKQHKLIPVEFGEPVIQSEKLHNHPQEPPLNGLNLMWLKMGLVRFHQALMLLIFLREFLHGSEIFLSL